MGENLDKLNELFNRRSTVEAGGGEELKKKLHSEGKFDARERIAKLLDDNTFVEFGAFVNQRATDFNAVEKYTPSDGVITGYGSIFGRLVFVYSQDSTVMGGSVGEMHAKKICGIYEKAMKMGAPVVGFIDSSGMRVQESVDALSAYGDIFKAMTAASGVVPQITAIMGGCMGTSSFIPALSDFTFAVSKNAKLFMVSPNTLSGEEGKKGDLSLKEENGLIQFVCEDEESCISEMRKLIDIVPSNNMEDAPFFGTGDDINRTEEFLNTIVPENYDEAVDMGAVIKAVADNGEFIEVQKNFAKEIKEGFIRVNGYTAGIISNNSYELTYHGTDKALKFLSFCDAFNIPVITLTDVGGYKAQVSQTALIKSTAKLMAGFAAATCPKINVIIRKGFGNPYLVMNSKHIGADVVFAWPTAEVSVMDPVAAVNVMYGSDSAQREEVIEKYRENNSSPYFAAKRGYIDDIIEPSATRKRIGAVLEMLATKREGKPAKKHSSFTI